MNSFAKWIGLIGIAATIPLVQTIATAKSSVEVAETARTITVLITSSDAQGSGVIIKREGDIWSRTKWTSSGDCYKYSTQGG